MGFEPLTSRYRCDALTNWAMKPLTLGAGHFVSCNEPVRNGCEVIFEIFHTSLHNKDYLLWVDVINFVFAVGEKAGERRSVFTYFWFFRSPKGVLNWKLNVSVRSCFFVCKSKGSQPSFLFTLRSTGILLDLPRWRELWFEHHVHFSRCRLKCQVRLIRVRNGIFSLLREGSVSSQIWLHKIVFVNSGSVALAEYLTRLSAL